MSTYFNFKTLNLSKRPNEYLILPVEFDCVAVPHSLSPIFNISSKELYSVFYTIIIGERAIKVTYSDRNELKSEFVQYTRLFRFPDDISVEFVEMDNNLSSIAIYSRSRIGYYDFRVNKRRVKRLINSLIEKTNNLN